MGASNAKRKFSSNKLFRMVISFMYVLFYGLPQHIWSAN